MDTLALFVLLTIGGVNFGWQPVEDGAAGYEYIVQVEPELVAALERGESVPIESNIPSEVAPIRKVRLVVGREDLPRTAVRHTANFAGQAGWTPDRYATSPAAGNSNNDRYSASASAGSGVQPPPSILDRTETAITETGSALSNGVQAAGEQMSRAGSQAWDDTRNAAQGFGQQIQQWGNDAGRQLNSASNNLQRPVDQSLDAAGNQFRQAGNSLGLKENSIAASDHGVSAPPWPSSSSAATAPAWPAGEADSRITPIGSTATPGMTMTRTNTGWTSIGSSVAAPPLLNPPIATAANTRLAASGPSGPNFPALPNATLPAPPSREPLHSVLVDPSRQPPASGVAANQWGNSWGTGDQTAQAMIGRGAAESDNSQKDSGLVPIRPVTPTVQDNREATNRWADPWAESDPWKQAPHNNSPQGAPQQPQSAFANSGPGTNAPSVQPVVGQAPPSNMHTAGFGVNPNLPGANASNAPISGTNLPGSLPPANQPPWLPLLLVSLSLVGSLSANLFLGWSYMDARHKYRTLVRKTADTFRRVTSAAA